MEQVGLKGWIYQIAELFGAHSHGLQVAALPCRMQEGQLEICLVTSRGSGRWIVPKGWAEPEQSHAATAAQEAWEEAGLKGTISAQRYGTYTASKGLDEDVNITVRMDVYLLLDPEQHQDFPEKGQRKVRWMAISDAISKVSDKGLANLLSQLKKTGLPS